MTNYALDSAIRTGIIGEADKLALRHARLAERDFPLTTGQIEACLCDPQDLPALGLLEGKNYGIKKCNYEDLGVDPGLLPGVDRYSKIFVHTAQAMFTRHYHSDFWKPDAASKQRDCIAFIAPSLDWPDDTTERLVRWINRSVRARRMEALVRQTVRAVLHENNTPTVYHAAVRWPLLATLAPEEVVTKDGYVNGRYGLRAAARVGKGDTWQRRLSERPRSPQNYDWPPGMPGEDLGRRMKVTETILAEATLLPDLDEKAPVAVRPVAARVVDWQKETRI